MLREEERFERQPYTHTCNDGTDSLKKEGEVRLDEMVKVDARWCKGCVSREREVMRVGRRERVARFRMRPVLS